MKNHIPVILGVVLIVFSGCQKKTAENYFESMNTFMKVRCYGENSEEANSAAQKYIGELEALISVTKPASDIYRVNHAASYPVEVSPVTAELLEFTLGMSEKTGGVLNPCLYPVTSAWGFTKKQYRIPSDDEIRELLRLTDFRKARIDGNNVTLEPGMMFDLGAVGKGFAGDEAAKMMRSYGITSALLDLGGNIQLIGSRPDGSDWTIGIRNPFGEGQIGTLRVSDCAVITSGGYERYFIGEDGKKYIHIFDGTTGRPVENNIVSATAVAPGGTYCDALSTTLFIMGVDRSIEFWRKSRDFDFMLITDDRKIYITKPLDRKFSLNREISGTEIMTIKK